MKVHLLFYVALLCLASDLFGQKHDFNWPLGYGGATNSDTFVYPYGISFLRFETSNGYPIAERDPGKMINLLGTNAPICDENGRYLFAYNGYRVEGSDNATLPNGNQVGGSGNATNGDVMPQTGIVLTFPGIDSMYLLVHMDYFYYFVGDTAVIFRGKSVLSSTIEYSSQDSLFFVSKKRKLVFLDSLMVGSLTATRHANGRDWWLLVRDGEQQQFFVFLASPEGVVLSHVQPTDHENKIGLGASAFSPDGSRFASINGIDLLEGTWLDYYDFDRCTGLLSNHHRTLFSLGTLTVGVGFSPNGRFLYAGVWDKLYQIDLESSEQDTIVADVWDGFIDTISLKKGFHFETAYGPFVNGPDGRLYSFDFNGSHHFINVVEHPDMPAPLCWPRQHSILMPTPKVAPPNFPNYRLGPLDGSSCDSLGINNLPWAHFRFRHDTLLPQLVFFNDASAYEPTHWHWDFGDGTTSSDINPIHEYNAPGIYKVCLIVSNAYGADTTCREVVIETVGIGEVYRENLEMLVYPNPCRDFLGVSANLPPYVSVRGVLSDALGRPVGQASWRGDLFVWDTGLLPPGCYFISIETGGQKLAKPFVKVD